MPLQKMMLHIRRAAAVLSAEIHDYKEIKLLPKANNKTGPVSAKLLILPQGVTISQKSRTFDLGLA